MHCRKTISAQGSIDDTGQSPGPFCASLRDPQALLPSPAPFPDLQLRVHSNLAAFAGVAKRVNWGNSSPPRLAGTARAAATSRPASKRSGPSSEPRASPGSGRVARGSRVARVGRPATCRPSPSPRPARGERPGADTSRVRPAEPGPSGPRRSELTLVPPGPPDPRRFSPVVAWAPEPEESRDSRARQRLRTRTRSAMAAKLLLLLCLFSGLHAR